MSGGRWQPNAYWGSPPPTRRPRSTDGGSPSGPSDAAPKPAFGEVTAPPPGRPSGCIWWLLLAAALALPAGVLAASLAHQAFR